MYDVHIDVCVLINVRLWICGFVTLFVKKLRENYSNPKYAINMQCKGARGVYRFCALRICLKRLAAAELFCTPFVLSMIFTILLVEPIERWQMNYFRFKILIFVTIDCNGMYSGPFALPYQQGS